MVNGQFFLTTIKLLIFPEITTVWIYQPFSWKSYTYSNQISLWICRAFSWKKTEISNSSPEKKKKRQGTIDWSDDSTHATGRNDCSPRSGPRGRPQCWSVAHVAPWYVWGVVISDSLLRRILPTYARFPFAQPFCQGCSIPKREFVGGFDCCRKKLWSLNARWSLLKNVNVIKQQFEAHAVAPTFETNAFVWFCRDQSRSATPMFQHQDPILFTRKLQLPISSTYNIKSTTTSHIPQKSIVCPTTPKHICHTSFAKSGNFSRSLNTW